MIGQVFSDKKYNVVILAGGMGSRMGDQSQFLPKALTPMGNLRAIDWIIYRYANIAKKFIIGIYFHGDLLKSYLKGKYPHLDMEFSEETELINNARSFSLCMDHTDTRYPTLLTFCDLIMVGNYHVHGDMLYIATAKTKGSIGTFRHSMVNGCFSTNDAPRTLDEVENGIVGTFVFDDTAYLKSIIYSKWNEQPMDITEDICGYYYDDASMVEEVEGLVEFGTTDELAKARSIWEQI